MLNSSRPRFQFADYHLFNNRDDRVQVRGRLLTGSPLATRRVHGHMYAIDDTRSGWTLGYVRGGLFAAKSAVCMFRDTRFVIAISPNEKGKENSHA